MIDVVIYSKPDCHLCEEAKDRLARLRARLGFNLQEVNILKDPESFDKFQEEIPVVFINGKKSFKYRVDEREFVRRVEAIRTKERKPENGA